MASPDSVGQYYQDSFGSFRLGYATGVSLAATGNAVVTIPILNGGIGPNFGNGSYIIRRITVTNPGNTAGGAVPSLATANVTVLTSNDGNTSNAVTTSGGQVLGNVTGVRTWQDLTLASGAATTAYNAPALFVAMNANTVANSSVSVSVWGDVVQF